jgi:hypothetical protein
MDPCKNSASATRNARKTGKNSTATTPGKDYKDILHDLRYFKGEGCIKRHTFIAQS